MNDPVFCVERFQDVYAELLPLLGEHYDEISIHKQMGYALKPNVAMYSGAQNSDQLLMMIGRLEGKIVAYFVAFVRPSIHYGDCMEGVGDIFYVEPTRRGLAHGKLLFAATETELTRRGVKCWMAGEKLAFPCGDFLAGLGFEPFERKFCKWL